MPPTAAESVCRSASLLGLCAIPVACQTEFNATATFTIAVEAFDQNFLVGFRLGDAMVLTNVSQRKAFAISSTLLPRWISFPSGPIRM
jgi:hypothetical protein